MRQLRRLRDLLVWILVFASGALVGSYWHDVGPAVIARLAALSDRRPDPDRPPVRAELGPAGRARLERLRAAPP